MDAIDKNRDLLEKNHNGHLPEALKPVTMIRHNLRLGLPYFSDKLRATPGFDLIFLDPPYSKGLSMQLLLALDTSALLREQTLLVVEDRARETLPEKLTKLTLVDQRKYGEAGFWFYQPLPDETSR